MNSKSKYIKIPSCEPKAIAYKDKLAVKITASSYFVEQFILLPFKPASSDYSWFSFLMEHWAQGLDIDSAEQTSSSSPHQVL